MLSNSGQNEWGGIYGGQPGDQGREWIIVPWYNYSPGGWKCVLRHPNASVRKTLADLARKAANNNNVGYNQLNRGSYWSQLQKAKYDPSKIKTPCDADCSAGVIANTMAAGYLLNIGALKNITATYTRNMRRGFENAGFSVLTESKYLTSDRYLLAGDILLNDEYHTCTVLDDGASSGGGGSVISGLEFRYAVRAGGKVYPEVVNLTDYAGVVGKEITDIAIKTNKGKVSYRVHVRGGNWLPWVSGYNWKDHANGYAGNGKSIDAVQVNLTGVSGQKAQYRVSPMRRGYYDWQFNCETSGGQDGYAGAFGKAIDRFQIF